MFILFMPYGSLSCFDLPPVLANRTQDETLVQRLWARGHGPPGGTWSLVRVHMRYISRSERYIGRIQNMTLCTISPKCPAFGVSLKVLVLLFLVFLTIRVVWYYKNDWVTIKRGTWRLTHQGQAHRKRFTATALAGVLYPLYPPGLAPDNPLAVSPSLTLSQKRSVYGDE